ncbi:polyamine-modulated factor 1-binding protein 1-like [Conger conger]|uniref:polyamine-modulated factor 1-binding protein 1-like n=1 Tax=Conger conger TaxID=82655 RepID=UPI002A5B0A9A|nr:polyamine-modulated factor 1-binding protein 1-like [Conger conger]
MELLAERSRELAGLRSELSRVQQRGAQQLQERTALEDRASQLSAELHTLRSVSRHSQDEVRAYEGRLAELSAQLTRAQRWGQEQLAALESREEEAVGMKVELASLREGYHSKANQVEALNSQLDMLKQRYRTAASEVDVLRQSLGTARTDSTRLQKESELVVSNVNQWVKEQKQANEKLGNTIKDQSKKIVHLTAEKDHLQGSVEALHRENRKLKAELDDSRIDAERLRALSVGQGVQSSGLLRVPSHRPAPVLRSDQVVRGSINAHRKKKPLAANLHS